MPVEKVVEICSRKDPLNWAAFIDYFAYLSGLIRGLIQVEDKETSQVSPELCILASDERLEEMLKKYCSLTLINLYNSLIKIDNDYSFLFQLSETGQGFAGGGQTERLSSHQS
ncbi:TPA: hypothetical protein HA317_04520, partial [Candidatus Woesearchaeota archaeon]|nr:hypothetical protein [Candidatus Woesearchaeota archaeon]